GGRYTTCRGLVGAAADPPDPRRGGAPRPRGDPVGGWGPAARRGRASGVADLGHEPFDQRGIGPVKDQPGALSRQRRGESAAQPTRCACHYDPFSVNLAHLRTLLLRAQAMLRSFEWIPRNNADAFF